MRLPTTVGGLPCRLPQLEVLGQDAASEARFLRCLSGWKQYALCKARTVQSLIRAFAKKTATNEIFVFY